jgi:hypothetical protein
MTRVLGDRALNRALLARQGLLQSWDYSPIEAIERLIGLQAQSVTAPYFGLWSRLPNFVPEQLSELLLGRLVVRISLMRSTLQLVSAADCLALRPVLASDLVRVLPPALRNRTDLPAIASRSRELLEEQPMTFAQLGKLLAERFSGTPDDLCRIARNTLALVQVTPRGVWGASMAATHANAESWLDSSMTVSSAPEALIQRYLRAFGPATVADLAAWSGLSRLRPHVERLELVRYRNARGQQLFDVPEGLLPDPETPVPVRIIAEFDNLLLGHADRSRIFDDQYRMRFMSVNGIVSSTFLIDGFVAGVCTLRRDRGTATLTLQPFGALGRSQLAGLRAEADRLLAFAAPDSSRRSVIVEK